MMYCLRIFGAYSFRLSRRHSTVLLILSLIGTLTILFHLYSYKHREYNYTPIKIGDFDYRPGAFLKDVQPNENKSYCEFNYGLPDSFKFNNFQIHGTPEGGMSSSYRVIYNVIKGSAYSNHSKYDAVTYATQATPEFIYHIVEIARYWDGPISLAVFVPNYDFEITIQIMAHLCRCYPGMAKVSLHLFYPKHYPPQMRPKPEIITTTSTEPPTTSENVTSEELFRRKVENYRNLDSKTRAEYIIQAREKKIKKMMVKHSKKRINAPYLNFDDCSGLENFNLPTYRREYHMIYPINVGRNVARNASRTNYFIVSDIEMVPSDGLAPKFLAMMRKLMGDKKRDEGCIFAKTVFVVPLFEVERGEEIPRDKSTLTEMVAANRARYFHAKFCHHCQRFPGLQTWLGRPSQNIVEPMLIARREYPYHRWEPLYFGTRKEPWYSEALSWEGKQDKMTQMIELCLQDYRVVVLDGAFLCHAASKPVSRHPKAERMNSRRYGHIIEEFKAKYPNKPRCRSDWGS